MKTNSIDIFKLGPKMAKKLWKEKRKPPTGLISSDFRITIDTIIN